MDEKDRAENRLASANWVAAPRYRGEPLLERPDCQDVNLTFADRVKHGRSRFTRSSDDS